MRKQKPIEIKSTCYELEEIRCDRCGKLIWDVDCNFVEGWYVNCWRSRDGEAETNAFEFCNLCKEKFEEWVKKNED